MFKWFRSEQLGCRYGMSLAQKEHMSSWVTLATSIPSSDFQRREIEGLLCGAADSDSLHAVLIVFKDIEQARDLARLIDSLCKHPSWMCSESRDVEPLLSGDIRHSLCLRWRMPDGSDAHALGFGPFAFLPATRRAPYSALTLPVCAVGAFRDPKLPPTERHLCDMRNDVFQLEDQYKRVGAATHALRDKVVEPHNNEAAKAKVTLVLPHEIFSSIDAIRDA